MTERDTVLAVTKTYSFPSADYSNNQITSVRDSNWNPLRTLTYRAGGDLYQDARSGGVTYSYSYNARKRAVQIQKGSTIVGQYGYDAFGRRVWRQVFSPSTVQSQYIYDLSGRLLAEHNGSTGAVVKEYVWIDDMPVAVVDSSSGTANPYFVGTGPVNEPLVMPNSAKAVVWNAYMEPFGASTLDRTSIRMWTGSQRIRQTSKAWRRTSLLPRGARQNKNALSIVQTPPCLLVIMAVPLLNVWRSA